MNNYAQVLLCQIYCQTWTNVNILKSGPILVGKRTNIINISFELGSFLIIIR